MIDGSVTLSSHVPSDAILVGVNMGLTVGGSSAMTDTFLNCQQNMFLNKFPQKLPDGYSFNEKLLLAGTGCFSEIF